MASEKGAALLDSEGKLQRHFWPPPKQCPGSAVTQSQALQGILLVILGLRGGGGAWERGAAFLVLNLPDDALCGDGATVGGGGGAGADDPSAARQRPNRLQRQAGHVRAARADGLKEPFVRALRVESRTLR